MAKPGLPLDDEFWWVPLAAMGAITLVALFCWIRDDHILQALNIAASENASGGIMFCDVILWMKSSAILISAFLCMPGILHLWQRIHAMEPSARMKRVPSLLFGSLCIILFVQIPLGAIALLWGDGLPHFLEMAVLALIAYPLCVLIIGYCIGEITSRMLLAALGSAVCIISAAMALFFWYYHDHCTSGPMFRG